MIKYTDFEILDYEEGEILETKIAFKEDFVNVLGALHGGVILAIFDINSGALAMASRGSTVTLSSMSNFLAPMLDSEYIYTKSKIIKLGKRNLTVDAEMYDDKGKLIAVNRADFQKIEMKDPKFMEVVESFDLYQYAKTQKEERENSDN